MVIIVWPLHTKLGSYVCELTETNCDISVDVNKFVVLFCLHKCIKNKLVEL